MNKHHSKITRLVFFFTPPPPPPPPRVCVCMSVCCECILMWTHILHPPTAGTASTSKREGRQVSKCSPTSPRCWSGQIEVIKQQLEAHKVRVTASSGLKLFLSQFHNPFVSLSSNHHTNKHRNTLDQLAVGVPCDWHC